MRAVQCHYSKRKPLSLSREESGKHPIEKKAQKNLSGEIKSPAPVNLTNVNVYVQPQSNYMYYNSFLVKPSPIITSKPISTIAKILNLKVSPLNETDLFHRHRYSIDNAKIHILNEKKKNLGKVSIIVKKYSYFTRVGFLPNNPYKVNQDNFIVQPKLSDDNKRHFFAVADGHGIRIIRPIWKRNIYNYKEHTTKSFRN